MPEYDLVIRGGTIVDGTGIPRFKADMAVKDGRVVRISGRIPAGGAREIDAAGCVVAPGAIDLHTHYDAQLNWDPYASLSGWFGVTSLTIGQCGFGFAPTRPEDRDLNMRMMNRIEAIPLESMRLGIRWDWETYPEFLDSLDRQGLGLNIGSVFPFSAMRGYVLGMMPARERTSVTEAELGRMKQLFHEGMRAGAYGFSLNKNMEDHPEDGGLLPSHVASNEEFLGLSEVLSEFGVGHIGLSLGVGLTPEQHGDGRELCRQMARISGRPVQLIDNQPNEDPGWVPSAQAEGLPIYLQKSAHASGTRFTLAEFNMFDYMPSWIQPLVGTPEERAAKLRDTAQRDAMKRDVQRWPNARTDWSTVFVLQVTQSRNEEYEGLTIDELARITGKEPVDALLDLALDEGLETEFEIPSVITGDHIAYRTDQLNDPYAHISVSDGGAHTRFLTLSCWPVYWLSFWIRDQELMSLEQAHYKMSLLPAWLADFRGRGTIRVGDWADIIVYNLDELGFVYDRPIFANDFPGGERRIIQKHRGLRYTIVNGTVTFEGNDCTGALPGRLLRSYDAA